MNYIDFLKTHETFDKYILFLLSLDFTPAQVAEMLGMSRQGIYNVIKRNEKIIQAYGFKKDEA